MSSENLNNLFIQLENTIFKYEETHSLIDGAFESDYIGMCTLSLDGKFERVNQACCDIWERERHELLNIKFQDITHPADLKQDTDFVSKLLNGDIKHYSMAKRYLMPDGSYKACWLEVSAIQDIKGVYHLFFSKILSINAVEDIYKELKGLINVGFN